MKFFPYLVLVRPANILTAISDVLAGTAIAGVLISFSIPEQLPDVMFLILATVGLYAGGIVFNDIFDFELDRQERPERILPSGQISLGKAHFFGTILLLLGIFMAFLANPASGLIAILITLFALLYDKYGKHHTVIGPLNMGLCRGLNLLLGMSIIPLSSLGNLVWISLMPVLFIAAVTLTSRGEVRGNNRASIFFALFLDLIITTFFLILGYRQVLQLKVVIPFVALWLFMNMYAKIRALINNEPRMVMLAVKTGVISLIPLNASYVAGFGHWIFAIMVLSLLPLALLLSRKFSVT